MERNIYSSLLNWKNSKYRKPLMLYGAKSLGVYLEKYNPKTAIRASLLNYGKRGNLIDLPIYAVGNFDEMIEW